MKYFEFVISVRCFILLASFYAGSGFAQSLFIPENGKYVHNQMSILSHFERSEMNYLSLRPGYKNSSFIYKYDSKRNEYQVKDWFLQDWYSLQNMFLFDQKKYVEAQDSETFNEAKIKQYSGFAFDKKKFFHWKTAPSMKEWGGLTHPPIKKLQKPLDFYDKKFASLDYDQIESPFFDPKFQKEIDNVSRSELSFGNTVQALVDHEAFELKKKLINKAQSSILMSSLVFVCDSSSKEIVDLLIRKHHSGVNVKVIVDGMISALLGYRDCLKRMRNAGISVLETKDFFKYQGKAIYHSKTLVIDLLEAVAGGHNMIDADNLSKGTDFKNRDVDLYFSGPIVTDIASQFVENWNFHAGKKNTHTKLTQLENEIRSQKEDQNANALRGRMYYEEILGNVDTRMNGVCRFVKQAPYEDRHTIGKAYLKLMEKTSTQLTIADPIRSDTIYDKNWDRPLFEKMDNFDMYNQLHQSLQDKAKRGLKIDFITTNINMTGNEHVAIMNDKIKEQLYNGHHIRANFSLAQLNLSNSFYGKPHYKNLLKDWMPLLNVKIWKHMSFMHSKIFYFDRVAASVGSYNFHHNATDHSYESTAICMDKNLNGQLDEILVQDMANSIPLIFSNLK